MFSPFEDEQWQREPYELNDDSGYHNDEHRYGELVDDYLPIYDGFSEPTHDISFYEPMSPISTPSPMTEFGDYESAQTSPIEPIPSDIGNFEEGMSASQPLPTIEMPRFPIPMVKVPNKNTKRKRFDKKIKQKIDRWLLLHQNNPYMSKEEKEWMMTQTGLTKEQLNTYLTNQRMRYLKGDFIHRNTTKKQKQEQATGKQPILMIQLLKYKQYMLKNQ